MIAMDAVFTVLKDAGRRSESHSVCENMMLLYISW